MGSRYVGIVSLERFLAVERYCESSRPVASAPPHRVPEPGGNTTPKRPGADRVSGKVR
jgi:hypothetical protein